MSDQGVLKNRERTTTGRANDGPGCWSCPHWQRANAATGHCDAGGDRQGWLTSYAYICPAHPEHRSAP